MIIVDELGFAPLDDTGAQLLFRFVAAAYERRALGVGSHHPFEAWGRFLPEHTTSVSLLDRLLHHCHTVITDGGELPHARGPQSRKEPPPHH
jgi:DNA replication protein DnaC